MSLQSEIMADAPKGYWRTVGSATAPGQKIPDSSGNNNQLEVWNNGGAVTGYPKDGASLIGSDATDASIDFLPDSNLWDPGADPDFALTGALSISFWFKARAVAISGSRDLVRTGDTGYGTLLKSNGSGVPYVNGFVSRGAGLMQVNSGLLALNTIYHVGLTFDSSVASLKLYIDGALVDSQTAAPGVANTSAMVALGQFGGAEQGFDGLMDEIAIFATALSAGRIAAHHVAGRATDASTTDFEAALLAGAFNLTQRGLMAGATYRLRRYYLAGVTDPLAHTLAKTNAKQVKALTDNGQLTAFDAITGP